MTILDASLEIVRGFELHCAQYESSVPALPSGQPLLELEEYSAQLRNHRSNVAAIVERSRGTTELVSVKLSIKPNFVLTPYFSFSKSSNIAGMKVLVVQVQLYIEMWNY